MIIARCS